jgi:hypothetical protein
VEYVRVEKAQLLEYVDYVERLISDHNRLSQQIKDAKTIASIVEETYEQRIDSLLDVLLDEQYESSYYQGLMTAYQIMRGRV